MLHYQWLTQLDITPEMKSRIAHIRTQFVEIKLGEEDYHVIADNLELYNQIYAEIRTRAKVRPLNEFSGELAVLTERVNVRSFLWRALSQLKLRLEEDFVFEFGIQIKRQSFEHVVMREYGQSEAKVVADFGRIEGGHRVVNLDNLINGALDTYLSTTGESNQKRGRAETNEVRVLSNANNFDDLCMTSFKKVKV